MAETIKSAMHRLTAKYWLGRPLRHCRAVRCCCLCKELINRGQLFYAGGTYGACRDCVEKLKLATDDTTAAAK